VAALDVSVASVSVVKVFVLRFADAKSVAAVIKDLFTPQEPARNTGSARNRIRNLLRGRNQPASPVQHGRAPTPPVVAVAEEQSNSVVVSASEGQMSLVEELIAAVDTDIDGITELRVFHLAHADAQETADLLMDLFADRNGSRGQTQVRGRRANNRRNNATEPSTRVLIENRVVAVADPRTDSVVVSAARQLMPEIGTVIAELDADPANQQQVFVFDVENTDSQMLQEMLQNLFPAPLNGTMARGTSARSQETAAGSQLSNRARQNLNQGQIPTFNTLGAGNGAMSGRGRR
jgi:general secretion pathway protein D